MKKQFLLIFSLLNTLVSIAQDSKQPFKGYFTNEEYNIYLKINLHDANIDVPDHELFGPLPGYLGKQHNNFYGLSTDCETKNKTATITLINDYGSEDLKASLRIINDTTLLLKQLEGSTLKVPNKGKWQKLPKELNLRRKR